MSTAKPDDGMDDDSGVRNDQLRLIFTRCHPALATRGTRPRRAPTWSALCAEAVGLARILAGLMPDEPEVLGLLALLLLHDARRAARLAPAPVTEPNRAVAMAEAAAAYREALDLASTEAERRCLARQLAEVDNRWATPAQLEHNCGTTTGGEPAEAAIAKEELCQQ